jgi:hypothetical protein
MGKVEGGSGTRRRPIGRDYAAAKDAECGKNEIGFLKTNEIAERSDIIIRCSALDVRRSMFIF